MTIMTIRVFKIFGSALVFCLLLWSKNVPACTTSLQRQIVDAITDYRFADARALIKSGDDSLRPQESLLFSASTELAAAMLQHGQQREQTQNRAGEMLQQAMNMTEGSAARDAYDTLVHAMSQAMIARIHMDRSHWLRAYRDARQARNQLQQLVQDHPQLHDAYTILGLYEYRTGKLPTALRWMFRGLGLSGNTRTGLAYLERGVTRAAVSAPEAARILLDELNLSAPEVCQWIPLNRQMTDTYPNNHDLARQLQRHLRECGYTEEALSTNLKFSRRFARLPGIVRRLEYDRLYIYRDMGDVGAAIKLAKYLGKSDNTERLLQETRSVRKRMDSTDFIPGKRVGYNDGLILNSGCPG